MKEKEVIIITSYQVPCAPGTLLFLVCDVSAEYYLQIFANRLLLYKAKAICCWFLQLP